MKTKTFIFIGPSGSGKGTQAKRLIKHLEEKDKETKLFYIETGARFREFIKGDGYSNKLSAVIYSSGARQPDFLAVRMWSDILMSEFDGEEHLVFDGTPRSLGEAKMLDTALDFYQREDVHIIFINVSHEWSLDRLMARGRLDDNREDIKKRLAWYDADVAPAVLYYKEHPKHTLLDINGEQTIDEVWEEMIRQIDN